MITRGVGLDRFAAACGVELEPFQTRVAAAVAGEQREVVVLLPRGQGKTHLLALVALHHLVTRGGRGGVLRGVFP